MVAIREVTWTHTEVSGSVRATLEVSNPKQVYFTDDEPEFRITFKNETDYRMREDSVVAWVLAIGEGRPEPFVREVFPKFGIPSGGEREITVSGEPLLLEGHGIVGVGQGGFHRVDSEDGSFKFSASGTNREVYEPLATFSVWDREHYEDIHEQPQRTQQIALFTSVLVVFFAILQTGSTLGYPFYGVLVGLALLAVYADTGHLSTVIESFSELTD